MMSEEESSDLDISPHRNLQRSHKEGESKDEEDEKGHGQHTLRQLGIIIRKMMVYEMEKKGPRFNKLKELENEQFQGNYS